jgi:hypothetical protein
MFIVGFLMNLVYADVVLIVVNNTRFELDLGGDATPYFANEFAVKPQEFGNILIKDKFRLGMRYKFGDHLKLDPHLYLQTQRKNDWKLDYGSTVRLDFTY